MNMAVNEEKNKENVIEFLTGEHYCSVTFTSRTHINRIKEIHRSHEDEFREFYVNADGSVYAKFPLKWIKVNPSKRMGRVISEEQKEKLRVQLEKARASRKKKGSNA